MIWTILGISVAILAAFAVSVAEIFVGTPLFENHRRYVAGALAAAGVIAWIIGRAMESRRLAKEDAGDTRFVLFDLRYWGPMLMAFGVIALFIRPLRHDKPQIVLAASKPAPKKVVVQEPPPLPEAPKPKAPAVFPNLKMQGVIYRERRPFAIINGESYTTGDHLGNIIVREIDRTSVRLELDGESKTLTLN